MISDVDTDLYITIQKAAAILGVTEAALRVAIREGRLRSEKMFRQHLILRTDFDAYHQRVRPNGERIKGRPQGAKDKKPRKARTDHADEPKGAGE